MRVVARRPTPSVPELRAALRAFLAQRKVRARPHDLSARDPDFIRRVQPWFDALYDTYFRCETEIEAEVPEGPVLAVANHNGMSGIPDMFCHMAAFWREYGVDVPSHGLMHDFPFHVPWAGSWLNASGAVAARPENAFAALSAGAKVLVFPGGDIDACKPYRDRYELRFAGRRGFLRVAIRAGVPVVPVVSVGAHSSLYLYSDGRPLARALRLPQLVRSNVFPVGFALPWGVIFGNPVPHLPPPVKIHTRIMAPIEMPFAPEDADEPSVLEEAFELVRGPMQAALYELRDAGRHGLWPTGPRAQ